MTFLLLDDHGNSADLGNIEALPSYGIVCVFSAKGI